MVMAAVSTSWTAEMIRALPDDGNRYEVIDGELFVTPSPVLRHQQAVACMFSRLVPYVRTHRIGQTYFSPADIEFTPHRAVQPDLFVAPLLAGRAPRDWKEIHSLLLAVEILSPSTSRADRRIKRRLYQEQGVAEYWIVDTDARLVERWTPADQRPDLATETLSWQPSESAPPLAIDLKSYFAEVWDES